MVHYQVYGLPRLQFLLFEHLQIHHLVWVFAKLSQPEIDKLRSKMVKLPPMNMALFQQELNSIDEDYPLSIPPSTILMVQIVMGLTLWPF